MIGLFLVGFANGAWDVAMNVQGAIVERHLGRAIMPRFHAGFSAGTVAGALVGALMVALDVSVTVHLTVRAVLVGAGAVRRPRIRPDDDPRRNPTSRSGARPEPHDAATAAAARSPAGGSRGR